MVRESTSAFDDVIERAITDRNVIAAFLTGSRGKGFHNENSDHDLYLVTDKATALPYEGGPGLDLQVVTWGELEGNAAWGTARAWDRYDFLHVAVILDRSSGELERLLREKSSIPASEQRPFVAASLDAYFNGLYRSLKCHRAGEFLGQRLEAVASIPPLLDALFGLHNRPRPFLGYVRKELEHYPLAELPASAPSLCHSLDEVLSTAAVSAQVSLFRLFEPLFRQAGYGPVFDSWRELEWIRNYGLEDSLVAD